jgi:hypothetical protein
MSTMLDSFFLLRRRGTGLSERTVTVVRTRLVVMDCAPNPIFSLAVRDLPDSWWDVVESGI